MQEKVVPRKVAKWAQEIADALTITPQFKQIKAGKWRVTFANKRVEVVFDLKLNKNRCWQEKSTLSIDGKERRFAKDLDQLAAFFKDPTGTVKSLQVPMVVPEAYSLDQAPQKIQNFYEKLRKKAPGHYKLILSRPNEKFWVIGIYLKTRLLELWCQENDLSKANLRLIIEGEDCSSDVSNLAEALEALTSVTRTDSAVNKGSVTKQTPQNMKATPVRKRTTVIRV